jgi:hypothetical protein
VLRQPSHHCSHYGRSLHGALLESVVAAFPVKNIIIYWMGCNSEGESVRQVSTRYMASMRSRYFSVTTFLLTFRVGVRVPFSTVRSSSIRANLRIF